MGCACSQDRTLVIYTCSGAADVGELADRTGRRLAREGRGKMSCTVGVGAGVTALRNTALSAPRILAIDGCAVQCVAKALAQAGVQDFAHLELGQAGFPKGLSPADDANLERAWSKATERLEA